MPRKIAFLSIYNILLLEMKRAKGRCSRAGEEGAEDSHTLNEGSILCRLQDYARLIVSPRITRA